MSTIRIADAQVGDDLVWSKPVHVDPFTSVEARFSGTLLEPPVVTEAGDLRLVVALSGGWETTYTVSDTTLAVAVNR